MEPLAGVLNFLGPLLTKGTMSVEDLGVLIEHAATRSPSAAFDWVARDPRLLFKYREYLGALQKGCRWLATVRRDDGDEAFVAVCEQLQAITRGESVGATPRKPLVVAWQHVGRHFKGSGFLGATITRWATPQEMLADPVVEAFLEQTLGQLDPTNWETQVFDLEYPGEVGFEGILQRKDIPAGYRVWQEERDGYEVRVNNAPAPRTRNLRFLFGQKPDCWLLISVWAGSTDSRPLTDTEWWSEWAFYDIR